MTIPVGSADEMHPDEMHVVHARAAGLDIHKMQITASVRVCQPGGGVQCATRQFSALPAGLDALTQWLASHRVTAAAMEATGIFWQAPWEALEAAGIEPLLLHAQFVKQVQGRKSDVADSLWLARICRFGLCRPSYVPPRDFRQLRQLSRYRRKLVGERSRARNRIHKTLDHDGLRLGGALTDIFGLNGRKILAGLAAGRSKAAILVLNFMLFRNNFSE
ncbi:MAG: transposase [Bryobacterales bacterium]|nr:transposase [Bryobacterales bacterium]